MGSEDRAFTALKSPGYRLLAMALGLLLVVLFFTGLVNYISFANNFNHSLASTYGIAGSELVRKIEYALVYGKPIENFYGMNDYLRELQTVVKSAQQLAIVSPEGDILYDLNGFVQERRLPEELIKTTLAEPEATNGDLSYRFYQDQVYLSIGIKDQQLHRVASLVMIFPKAVFLQLNNPFTFRLLAWMAGIALGAFAVLLLVFSRQQLFKPAFSLPRRKILVIFITVLAGAQILFSGANYFLFQGAYLDMTSTSQEFVEKMVNHNLQDLNRKGLTPQSVKGFDAYLRTIYDRLPQIQKITPVKTESTMEAGVQSWGQVRVVISPRYIGQQMQRILLDMLTVLVIAIFFMIELTLLTVIMLNQRVSQAGRAGPLPVGVSYGLIRALIFFVNLGACFGVTFIPLVMRQYYQPLFGWPRDVVLGLPLSAEMLGGMLAIILAGRLMRKGWRNAFYLGVGLLTAGNLLSGIVHAEAGFIAARFLAGWGLGCILMILRGLLVSLPDNNAAIAEFSAGSLAGLNCGAVIGGLLADRIGYAAVFYLAAAVILIPTLMMGRLIRGLTIEERPAGQSFSAARLTKIVVNSKNLVFLGCIFIPYFISGAFLDYYFPLFASGQGISQSDISRGILLNGLCIIYLGPVLTRYVTRHWAPVRGIMTAVGVAAAGVAVFALGNTVTTALVTLILLGIADSFGVALQITYFLNLDSIRHLKISQATAGFSMMINLSRMLGPLVYGLALSLSMGVGIIPLLLLALSAVFMLMLKRPGLRADPPALD